MATLHNGLKKIKCDNVSSI